MAESSDLDDDWTTKYITWRVSVRCEASTGIAALVELQIEMVDTGRVPRLCGYAFDCIEVLSGCALYERFVGFSIDVDCRPVPVPSRCVWQWLIVEVVISRTRQDLDISDRVVIEKISVHVAVRLHVAGK